jgi:hypothetical protein
MNQLNRKKLSELAEVLFERACRERGYRAERIVKGRGKTPDFKVVTPMGELAAEVKSPGFQRQLQGLIDGHPDPIWMRPGERVREIIKDSEDQLAAYPGEVPRLVVVCDLRFFLPECPIYPWYGFNKGDLASGMFGEPQFVFEVGQRGAVSKGSQLGGNRTLRPDKYVHVSAVTLLFVESLERPERIETYHNPFASCPVTADVFAAPKDKHFRLKEVEAGYQMEWEEVRRA